MKRPAILLVVAGLAVIFGFMGWALWQMGGLDELSGGRPAVMIMIVAGVVVTGGLTALLMGLAFYSDKKGFDETVQFRDPRGEDRPED